MNVTFSCFCHVTQITRISLISLTHTVQENHLKINARTQVRLSHVFRGGSIFMCMDAAVGTGPAVRLSPVEDHGVIPTIVSVDVSTSGVMRTSISFLVVLVVLVVLF